MIIIVKPPTRQPITARMTLITLFKVIPKLG